MMLRLLDAIYFFFNWQCHHYIDTFVRILNVDYWVSKKRIAEATAETKNNPILGPK